MASSPSSPSTPSRGDESPSDALARTLRHIYDLDLTTTSGGNLSLRDRDGSIWITPAGLDKGRLRADQISHVQAQPAAVEPAKTTRASSELPFHRAIYSVRPDLRAIVHAHPVSLVAFSIAQQAPDTRVSAHAHALCGTIGFATYALPGSRELGERIADVFAEGFDCIVLQNHGVVVGGSTLRQAFERLEALDLVARTILRARSVGQEQILQGDELTLEFPGRGSPAPSMPAHAATTTDRERELRREICSMRSRARDKRLMTTTQGDLSARLGTDSFLMTPPDIERGSLEPEHIRVLPLAVADLGKADSSALLHAALYRSHSEVHAVAHGFGAEAGGFGTAGLALPSRTIPESYLLIREPVSIPLIAARRDPEIVATLLCPDAPVGLVQNGGAITLGVSLLDAFDRLEVLEATAAAVIASREIGELTIMSESQIDALRATYFPNGGLRGTTPGDSR